MGQGANMNNARLLVWEIDNKLRGINRGVRNIEYVESLIVDIQNLLEVMNKIKAEFSNEHKQTLAQFNCIVRRRTILKIIATKAGRGDDLRIEKSEHLKNDLGLDSLDIFELIMDFEHRYNIKISNAQIEAITDVQSVIDLVECEILKIAIND
ncbi:MAG: DUF1493 family protein [Rikenellaceae bacterium]